LLQPYYLLGKIVPAWLEDPLSGAGEPVAELILHYLHCHALPRATTLDTVNAAADLVESLLKGEDASVAREVEENDRPKLSLVVLEELAALCRRYAELDAIQRELMAIGTSYRTFIVFLEAGEGGMGEICIGK
jgi:hypothetical protein